MKSLVFFISTCLLFMCCNNNRRGKKNSVNGTVERRDTSKPVIAAAFPGKAYPAIFEAAFHFGTKVSQGGITYLFYNNDIGNIKIESGKIIACDPIVMHDASPFTQIFPTGRFPVHLAMAKTDDDERVGFSRILFSEKPVERWEFALKKGQPPIPLRDTNFYCYGVDAGRGLFIDSVANYYFNQKNQADWEDVFVKKAVQNNYKGYIHPFENHNLATFPTGYGDGCYATYIGFAGDGTVCQLLTDFGIVEWWRL